MTDTSLAIQRLTRAKFSGLDFDSIQDDVLARLQVKFAADFNDFALASLGIVLLDSVSFGLDTLSFYLDRRATDVYLATAHTRGAVARITRQLGYKMRGAIASAVDLDVAVASPVPFAVPILKGFRFQGPNALIFETARDVLFPAFSGPATVIEIPCFEGQTLAEAFVSDGTANQVFALRAVPPDNFVVAVSVKVDGAPSTENTFLTFEKTNQFEAGLNDDPPTIRFGDGDAGNIPPAGATIAVTYTASRGKAGQAAKDTITKEATPLVVNFQAISLLVNNPTKAVGGDDPESLEHAKLFAGKVFKTRDVTITRLDYESQGGSFADPLFGRVAVAQAIAARSAESDLELQNILASINVSVTSLKPTIDANTAAAEAGFLVIDGELAKLVDSENQIQVKGAQIVSDADSLSAGLKSSRNRGADAQQVVIEGKAAIDAIPTGADSLTVVTKNALKAFFDGIDSSLSIIVSNSDSGITTAGDAKDQVVFGIGNVANIVTALPESAKTNLEKIGNLRKVITAQVGVVGPPSTALRANIDAIQLVNVDTTTAVAAETQEVFNHLDTILSADCKANLVTVPILARDAAGFYAAPSVGMVQALQAFLDVRKEVSQTVKVTSGANFLLPVVLKVRIGVTQGFSESTTKTSVSTALDGVLRDRKFGASLFISPDLTKPTEAVEGVSFINIEIQGFTDINNNLDTTQLDAEGNLVISDNEVITKGTFTITTEVVKPK